MTLEFRLLGDVAALADGRAVNLGGTRQRSLFALLLLQRNRPLPTEHLIDRLWPDEPPLTAVKTVQVYVSRLRRALGPHAGRLTSTRNGYQLVVADDELDASRFERGLRLAREAVESAPADTTMARLEDALALWSGSAMSDLVGEPFADREAERLEELRIQAVEELCELRIRSGRAREAIGDLRRLLDHRPERERLWRLLMLALYADDRQGEALQAYQEARRFLAEELGLDPSQDLQDLEHAILTQTAPNLKHRSAWVASPDRGGMAPIPPGRADGTAVEPLEPRTRRIVTVLRANILRPNGSEVVDPEAEERRDRPLLERLCHAVERHGGTIETDAEGATAIFGLTFAREDDALRAVRAAAEMREMAGDSADQPTPIAIGIATGTVIVDSGQAWRLTVTGSVPRTAARLAAVAHAAGGVLVSGETDRLLGDGAATERVPTTKLGDVSDLAPLRLLSIRDGGPVARRVDTPMIGRGPELGQLLEAFDRMKAGVAPGRVTVIGEPGIGKSRLVDEFLRVIAGNARVLRARCLPYGEGITYWPVRELVFAAIGLESSLPTDAPAPAIRAITDRIEQGEGVRRGISAIVGLPDEALPPEQIPWAIRRFLEALAEYETLVLVLDDLQWAEPALLDLLDQVLDLGRRRMLVVAMARPELEDIRPGWLSAPGLALVRLGPLAEADAATLLDGLAPRATPGPLRARVVEAADGNPLFVEQFAAFVSDAAVAARMRQERVDVALPLPPTITSLLAARLDRLPAEELRLLRRASVIGTQFPSSALRELLPDEARAAMPGGLARLVRRELIRPDRSDVVDDDLFSFRHLLIRDAAYASVPMSDRAELHMRVAGWLERRLGSNPDQLDLIVGHHLTEAYRNHAAMGDDGPEVRELADRALKLIGPAGQRAEARGDSHAAVSLLSRAVELAAPGPNRAELLLDLRSALRTLGALDRAAVVDAELVAALATTPNEGLERHRSLSDARFSFNGTLEGATEAYAFFERASDPLGMIRALDVAYTYHVTRGELAAGMEMLDRATALAEASGRSDLIARFVSESAHWLVDSFVPVPEALERCSRYLDRLADNRAGQAGVLLAIGQLAARSGIHPEWRRHFESAKAIIDDLGLVLPLGAAIYPMTYGNTALAIGEPASAIDPLRDACEELERLGSARPVTPLHGPLSAQSLAIGRAAEAERDAFWGLLATAAPLTAQTLLALGQLDEVERYAFRGRDVAEADDLDAQARWRFAIAGLRSRQDRHAEAVTVARESVALLSDSQLATSMATAYMTLATSLRAAGDVAGALEAARDAHRIAEARKDLAALATIEAFLSGQ